MSDDDEPEYKVGYRRPPVETRFKKGQSGNPRGRPPKVERSLTARQLRRDIFRVAEMQTTLRTPEGDIVVTIAEAIYFKLGQKAIAGHGPSMRFFLSMYGKAVLEHFEVHKREFEALESLERQLTIDSDLANTEWGRTFPNQLRKLTRRT